jgi:hypothetical protein
MPITLPDYRNIRTVQTGQDGKKCSSKQKILQLFLPQVRRQSAADNKEQKDVGLSITESSRLVSYRRYLSCAGGLAFRCQGCDTNGGAAKKSHDAHPLSGHFFQEIQITIQPISLVAVNQCKAGAGMHT